MIDIKAIKKAYNKSLIVLDHANLTINDDEFVYIIGKSGAGKSTLLNILALFDVFDEGEYIFNGQDITLLYRDYPHIRNEFFGFVFQTYHLIEGLTAYDNVILPFLYSNKKVCNVKKSVTELSSKLQIEHLLHKKACDLSGGERQRVAFARAMITNPKYIFCDEPTGNLDGENSDIILDLLHNAHKEGKTIIVVTHDSELVKRDAKVLYEIREKKIVKLL